MFYTLSSLFNSMLDSPAVRLMTLIEHLNRYANIHIEHEMIRRNKVTSHSNKDSQKTSNNQTTVNKETSETSDSNSDPNDSVTKKTLNEINGNVEYALGRIMVTLLNDRELITLSEDMEFSSTTMKKDDQFFVPETKYVLCNFDFNIGLLAVKLNLPMICKPRDWEASVIPPRTLSDLHGGY